MAEISIEGVTKTFDGETRAVDDVTLTIDAGEFMVLVGPSGCGKSTLLRIIAGLEEATRGRIVIGGKDVTDLAPRDRDIAMVFQSYALYPHMTVRENLGFGLRVRGLPKDESTTRIAKAAEILRLADLLDRRPAALSGGQRQRVAMGRAIVREPKAFLMDEPLSNLDAKLRVSMRAELAELHARLGTTTVYVTHDQVEAMTLGERVAVLRDGRIQQVASPQELYRSPANLFVASFIGSPAMNLVKARLENDHLEFGGWQIPFSAVNRPHWYPDEAVVGIRPESFEDARLADPSLPSIEVMVSGVEELGADAHVLFSVNEPQVRTDERVSEEDEAMLIAERTPFTARLHPETRARPGAPLRLALDPRHFHFFDPESGISLDGPSEPAELEPVASGSR
jgi:multiple sugar transport system ATP-binding protein